MAGESILQAALATYQPLDIQGAITGAQKIRSNESQLARMQQELRGGELDLEKAQLELGAEREAMPLKSALVRAQTKSALLADAISSATDAESWDNSMRRLSQQFPEAAQYVGRYTPILQSRLMGVFGGQQGAAKAAAGGDGAAVGAADPANLDYQFSQTTPEQRGKMLEQLQKFTSALEQVSDENSWNEMRGKLHAEGVPLMDKLGDYSPIKAANIYSKVQPMLDYLQGRSVRDQAGIPNLGPPPETKVAGNTLYTLDPYTGKVINQTSPQVQNEFTSAGTDADGNPIIYNKRTGDIKGGDGAFGFEQFAERMEGQENATGDRTAQNPRSTATGNGQFTEGTWLDTVKAARPELAKVMNDKQLLELRKDPAFSREMTKEYAQNNARILQANGEPVTATSLALAHRFGPQGALGILASKPDTPLSAVLSADAIKANPGLEKETAGSYTQNLMNRVGHEAIGSKPAAQPEDARPVDQDSQSILSHTGLGMNAFYALTGRLSQLPRDKITRGRATKEAEAFANKRGVDVSTLESQFKAYNKTLEQNIERVNNTKIMEGELQGTLENLKPVADAAGLGKLRVGNIAQQFASGEFNDPTMQEYSFYLNQLRSELAAYNGALAGRSGSGLTQQDYHEAERVIKSGLDSQGAGGLLKAVHGATEKMNVVLEGSVDSSRKAIWDLFGVGDKFKPQYKKKTTPPPAAGGRGGAKPTPQEVVDELRRRGLVK